MSEINQFAGYHAIQEEPYVRLPRGGYIAKIIDVKLETNRYVKQHLLLQVEIIEGTYANFYHQDYEARKASPYEAKYHGVYNIAVPVGDGTEQDLRDLNRFNRTMGAVEASNPGYQWDWHLSGLKGKNVGLSVREYEFRGGIYTEIGKFIPTTIIRTGRFQPMSRRIVQELPATQQTITTPHIGSTYAIPGISPTLPSIQKQVYTQPAIHTPPMPTNSGNAHSEDDEAPF